jgi:nitroreductase
MNGFRDASTIDLLRTRRSAKLAALIEPGPGEDDLRTMLTIAARVPDHAKLVPWRFVVIAGERRGALGRVIGEAFAAANPGAEPGAVEEARKRIATAPLVVAVVFSPKSHPKVPEWEQVLSTGAACMNLLVAARALGYGAVWLSEWYAYDRAVLRELGLAETEKLAGFVHIGTEREGREDRERPSLERVVRWY